jgi:NADP-reducing hydrogenase subunit HndC
MKHDHHIYVCTNHKGRHCNEPTGLALIALFKKKLKKKGLAKKIKVERTGCLHVCKHGPALCIYPKGTFYVNVKEKDVKKIVRQHLIKGKKFKKRAL